MFHGFQPLISRLKTKNTHTQYQFNEIVTYPSKILDIEFGGCNYYSIGMWEFKIMCNDSVDIGSVKGESNHNAKEILCHFL